MYISIFRKELKIISLNLVEIPWAEALLCGQRPFVAAVRL